jgi:glycyl-tRNA synthetase alpha subunit
MAVFRDNLDADLIDSKLSPEAVDKVLNTSKYRNKMEALKGKAMAKKLALISRINNKAEKAMASIEEKLTALPEARPSS